MNANTDALAQLRPDVHSHGPYMPLITAAKELLVSWDFHRAGRETRPEFEALRTAIDALGASECPICADTHTAFGKRCTCTQGGAEP